MFETVPICGRDAWAARCAAVAAQVVHQSDVVFQSTSGTAGAVIRVPRSAAEIEEVFRRVAAHYTRQVGQPPTRVAILGGSAHAEVAKRWQLAGVALEWFEPGDVDGLGRFSPDAISGYPSQIRELAVSRRLELPALRAIKLGGERVFRADIARLGRRWPGVPVIEQLGSTEMPAVAVRLHLDGAFTRAFCLERSRFDFLVPSADGWHPLVVRDRLPGRLVPFDDFYDTGDEVRLEGGDVVDVRRRGDAAWPFVDAAEALLARGCTQVQFDLRSHCVRYTGQVELAATTRAADRTFATQRATRIERQPGSEKVPLVRS